jgi:hypothetical protein
MTIMNIIKKYPKIFANPGWHDCPTGWLSILDGLCEKLQKLSDESGHQVVCMQVKEKFASLRFYIESGTDQQYEIIEEAERESEKTCQNCGSKRNVSINDGGWLSALCEDCRGKE